MRFKPYLRFDKLICTVYIYRVSLNSYVSIGREQHALQPLALAVVGVRAFLAVAHARIYSASISV